MKKLLLIMTLSICMFGLNAQEIGDWEYADYGDYKFQYKIISLTPPECMLDAAWIYSEDAEIVIPSSASIDGNEYIVVGINASFYLGKSIYIPQTISTISGIPFYGSTISKVTFENNSQLTKLEHSTFANASSLSSIDFGDNSELTIIEGFRGLTGVFHNCTSLTNVDFGKNSKLKAIGGGTETPGGTGIFSDCTSLKNIRIPSSVTKLGAYVFEGCTSLISVEFDSNSKLDTIGYRAFDECYALKNVDLSKCSKLKSIDSYVFSDCSSLENIKLPNTIEEIGYSTFGNCFSLKNINLSQCTKLKYINSSAFEKCQSLINIELPIGVEEIGNAAFYMCSSLQNINLINTKLTAIRTQSFSGCSSLTSVILPGTISIIEHYAFSGCSELRSLMCYAESVPSINISAFDGCPDDLVVFVPAVSVALYKSDFTWGQYIIKPLEELNMVEFISENEINIYPNPAKDNLCIETNVKIDEVCVYNINGVMIHKEIMGNILDVSVLNSGIYFIKVKINNKEVVKYFVKE